MSEVLMKCGHVSNAIDEKTKKPVCAICIGLTDKAEIVEENLPDITNRIAKCSCCENRQPSSFKIPFFEFCGKNSKHDLDADEHYREDVCKHGGLEHDYYYCGCFGWD